MLPVQCLAWHSEQRRHAVMHEAIVPARPWWEEADGTLAQWLRKPRALRDPRQLTVAPGKQSKSLMGYIY